MAKAYRKAKEKLDARLNDYDGMKPNDQYGRKRPGSMKLKRKGRR